MGQQLIGTSTPTARHLFQCTKLLVCRTHAWKARSHACLEPQPGPPETYDVLTPPLAAGLHDAGKNAVCACADMPFPCEGCNCCPKLVPGAAPTWTVVGQLQVLRAAFCPPFRHLARSCKALNHVGSAELVWLAHLDCCDVLKTPACVFVHRPIRVAPTQEGARIRTGLRVMLSDRSSLALSMVREAGLQTHMAAVWNM